MELRNLRGLTEATVTPYRITGAAPGDHLGLPSPTVTLIVDLGDGLVLSTGDGSPPRRFRCCLGGMHVRPVTIHHDGTQVGVEVDLAPAAVRALFGMPPAELWNRNSGLGDLAPGLARRLHEQLAETPHERRGAAAAAILGGAQRRLTPRPPDPDAALMWRAIAATRGRITVAELTERSGWSARYLTGVFTAEYGLSPKQAARLVRFDHARRRLDAGAEPIAVVAADCGFADQAHLTREFTAFTGHPPGEYLAVRAAEFADAKPTQPNPAPPQPAGPLRNCRPRTAG